MLINTNYYRNNQNKFIVLIKKLINRIVYNLVLI